MNKLFAIAAAALALATPAVASAADFTGPRIGVVGGYDDVQNRDGFTYGVVAGVDAPIAKGVTLGVEATLEDSTVNEFNINASRELGLAVRAGVKLTDNVLAFGKVGYTNARIEVKGTNLGASFEGIRYGAGLEYAASKRTYVTLEYRRSEYEDGIGGRNGVLVGAGLRF